MSAGPRLAQFAPRSSIGVRTYAESLAAALTAAHGLESSVQDKPQGRHQGGHFHFANSTRSLIPHLLTGRGPMLLTVHDVLPRSALIRLLLSWPQWRLLRTRPIVVHSNAAAALLPACGTRQRVHVIPHAADPIRLQPERAAAMRAAILKPGQRLLVSAGIQNTQKRVPELIRAMARFPNLVLLLCGAIADQNTQQALSSAGENVVSVQAPDHRAFQEHIAIGDFLVNLRPHFIGESSGPVSIAYAQHVPILGCAIGAQKEYSCAEDQLFPVNVSIEECLQAIADSEWNGEPQQRSASVIDWAASAQQYIALYERYGLENLIDTRGPVDDL